MCGRAVKPILNNFDFHLVFFWDFLYFFGIFCIFLGFFCIFFGIFLYFFWDFRRDPLLSFVPIYLYSRALKSSLTTGFYFFFVLQSANYERFLFFVFYLNLTCLRAFHFPSFFRLSAIQMAVRGNILYFISKNQAIYFFC